MSLFRLQTGSFLSFYFLVVIYSSISYADEPSGMIEAITGKEINHWTHLDEQGIRMGGWITGGIAYNPANPSNHSNGPVNMTDRSNEFNLYQMGLYFEKAIAKADFWEIGGRVDTLFGTDSRFVHAEGHWDKNILTNAGQYSVAIPQAYLEVFSPIANGITTKIGHFYSILGYESVASGLNFFASHSYSFKSSPFTATGALINYPINDEWSINIGAITAPDNLDKNLGAWNQMNGITWNNLDSGSSFTFSVIQGDISDSHPSAQVYYSGIFQQSIENFAFTLEHDRGTLDNANGPNTQSASWYSVVSYLTYQWDEHWGAGLRGEWFKDQNGYKFNNGEANYYALTAGINIKPKDWLLLRPELRYDWSSATQAPFNGNHYPDQFLINMDAIIQF